MGVREGGREEREGMEGARERRKMKSMPNKGVCAWGSLLLTVQSLAFSFVVVDCSLPRSLKHVVSNAEYYGPSIYLPGMECTRVIPHQMSPCFYLIQLNMEH